MPDLPPSKRRPVTALDSISARPPAPSLHSSAPTYAELHCKTNYSFLRGASHPDELVVRAAELGYAALAITDLHSLAGVARAHHAAKEVGLKLLIGAEIHPTDAPPLVLLATDRASYGRLSRLLTVGKRRAPKAECVLSLEDVAQHSEGLLALVGGAGDWGSGTGEQSDRRVGRDEGEAHQLTAKVGLASLDPPYSPSRSPTPDSQPQATAPALRILRPPHEALREIFADRCYLLAELHRGPDDNARLERLAADAQRWRLPLVAANDVHYHVADRRALQDVLSAIRAGCTVAEAGARLFVNAQRHLHSSDDMLRRFARYPAAVRRTVEIADRCTFSLDELRYEYPEELCPDGTTPFSHLAKLTWAGARDRYPAGIPDNVRQLVERELCLIGELRYEAYFLTVWDLVHFARSRGILCQGRGSAANSAVCYCLGVTAVDPARIDVLFERFISRERNEVPDIDLDFEHERREEVLQYVYNKYGRDRAGMTAEVITYRTRSAVRDVGKALGLSLEQVDRLAKTFDGRGGDSTLEDHCRMAGVDGKSLAARQLGPLVRELLGFPRHLSQHVGGMVITRGPLCELVPIENAAMPDRTVIEWDKDDLDILGILKVDCLALGMLTAIHKCFDLVKQHHDRDLTLASVPAEDPAVYDMICRADTIGVFQIESRAQMSMLPRLQPREFYDLVIEVAIVRPGPIQGNMVHPYLRRRAGEEEATYPNDEIREVLHKTMGVPIFQEQAMRLAVVAAGFTPDEADQLRRAMGAWRKTGVIEKFRRKLIDGMLERGLTQEYAEQVFQQISGFGEYGFPESHSASFALLVYVSAWLKCHYPAASCAAVINSQPMGFYAPAQLVRDARQHGVEVRTVDVNESENDCTLEAGVGEAGVGSRESGSRGRRALCSPAPGPRSPFPASPTPESRLPTPVLRLGFCLVSGLTKAAIAAILAARPSGRFRSLPDLARRARLTQPSLVRLAKAQAFGSLGIDRRGALWTALAQKTEKPRPLFDTLDNDAGESRPTALPALDPFDEVLIDYHTAGLSLRGHPMQFLRHELQAMRVVRCADLATIKNNRLVRVAGLVLVRQRPGTARGITFVTIEDETGVANLVVRPDIWQRFRRAANSAAAMLVLGRLERKAFADIRQPSSHEPTPPQQVIHVLVSKIEDLAPLTQRIRPQSRDFH